MPDITIRGLDSLTRAVEGVRDKLPNPSLGGMNENSRHREILGIQKEQGKILKKQNFFTELLAVATLILALSSFLSLYGINLYNGGNISMTLIMVSAIFLVGCIAFIIIRTLIYFIMRK